MHVADFQLPLSFSYHAAAFARFVYLISVMLMLPCTGLGPVLHADDSCCTGKGIPATMGEVK